MKGRKHECIFRKFLIYQDGKLSNNMLYDVLVEEMLLRKSK